MIHCCFFDITCSVNQINHMVVGYLANISFNLLPDIYIHICVCIYWLQLGFSVVHSVSLPASRLLIYICMESNRFCKDARLFLLYIWLVRQHGYTMQGNAWNWLFSLIYLIWTVSFRVFLNQEGVYINAGHGMFFFFFFLNVWHFWMMVIAHSYFLQMCQILIRDSETLTHYQYVLCKS